MPNNALKQTPHPKEERREGQKGGREGGRAYLQLLGLEHLSADEDDAVLGLDPNQRPPVVDCLREEGGKEGVVSGQL